MGEVEEGVEDKAVFVAKITMRLLWAKGFTYILV